MLKRWTTAPSLLLAMLLYALLMGYIINKATNNTGGKLTYIYDDAYIHMAMAKNFAQHGVWGVTPHEFSSTTSSPVWTLLEAAIFKVTGVQEIVPLILNILAALSLLAAYAWIFQREGLPGWYSAILLVAAVLLIPLHFLSLTGMEHVLHTLLTVLYLYLAASMLAETQISLTSRPQLILYALTPLLVLTRYEGAFLAFTVGMLCLLRRRYLLFVLIGALAALPWIIYAAINVAQDWFILPGSVLIKADRPREIHGLKDVIWLAVYYPRHGAIVMARDSVFATLGILGMVFFWLEYRQRLGARTTLILLMFVVIFFFHMMFGAPFIRYYPYLVGALILGVGLAAYPYLQNMMQPHPLPPPRQRGGDQGEGFSFPWNINFLQQFGVLGLVVLFVFAPLIDRGYDLFQRSPGAMTNMHDQQYQMALFVRQYYNDERVAMNDIGTTSLLTDFHLLDLVGLGTLDVAKKIVNKQPFGAVEIEQTAQAYGAKIALVYDAWYDIPDSWIPVGYWSTPSAGFLGSDVVTIYAIDPAEEEQLAANLREFSGRLPLRVTQWGAYLEPEAS